MQSVNRITFARSTNTLLSYCHRRFLTRTTTNGLVDYPGGGRDCNKIYYSYCCRRSLKEENNNIIFMIPSNYYHSGKNTSLRDDSSNEWGVQEEKTRVNPPPTVIVASIESGLGPIQPHNKKWLTKTKKKDRRKKAFHKTRPEYQPMNMTKYNEMMETFPQIEELDEYHIKQLMVDAAVYGFTHTQVAKMLCRYPQLLDNYEELFSSSAKAWRIFGFTESERVSIFVRNPQLMKVPAVMIANRYRFLSEFFSKIELTDLVKNNPHAVVEDENLLAEKINQLWKQYSHSTINIAKSDTLSHHLDKITVRHAFLIRTGFFRPVAFHKFLKMQAEDDRRRMRTVRDKYYPPSDIVCTGDEKFLRVCTQNTLTPTDLHVFEKILKIEEMDEHHRELDELEESDDDDDGHESGTTTSSSPHDAEDEEYVDDQNEEDQNPVSESRYRWRHSSETFSIKDNKDFYY